MANEFTYASSARPMQATSSFQDLLDAERQKTVQAIAAAPAQTAAAVAGLADARSASGEGNGDRGASPDGGNSGASRGGSMAQGNNAAMAGSVLGGIAGLAFGGIGGAVKGASIGSDIGNNLGLRSAERSHMSPEQQAIAKDAVAFGGMNSDDAGLASARRFWVIKHGIKASGMSAWGQGGMGDEAIWDLFGRAAGLPPPASFRRAR